MFKAMTVTLETAYATEIAAYREARTANEKLRAWHHLERAHILGQLRFGLHIRSHLQMLGYAIALKDGREIVGQVVRLALAPLGNLTGRLPIGNTGRAHVSAFVPMEIPEELQRQIKDAGAAN
jgi:Protein of unknown function (DUF3703)